MWKMKFIGSGMNPEYWDDIKGVFNQELVKVLNEAKSEQRISLERIGEVCGYSKSQVDNFLKGRTVMDRPTMKKMVNFLKVNDKVGGTEMFERLQRSIIQMTAPDLDAEEVERMMDSFWDDGQEYTQWEKIQERQLTEMEPWFMDMDIRDCYLLDEYYGLYEKAKIPDMAWGFIQNYTDMERTERERLRACMETVTIPIGALYRQFHLVEKFRRLVLMYTENIGQQVKKDMVQDGRVETYTSREFLQVRKQEHWESFRNKIKDSSYITGDYFYERMRLLTRMDADAWEMLILFLLMGNGQGASMTQWQNLFDSIVPDVDGKMTKEENGDVRKA